MKKLENIINMKLKPLIINIKICIINNNKKRILEIKTIIK